MMPTDTLTDTLARLHMRDIIKTFPGVKANDRVSLTVQAGEIHALLGENGAGKTTLMRILYGLYQPDAGDIFVRGQPVRMRSPRQAMALGIGLVAQQFLLIRQHTVAENLALGLSGLGWLFPLRRVAQRLRALEEHYGLIVDPNALIWQLSPGEQQRVEIVKALLRGGDILILDEPTGLLMPQEIQVLFQGLRRMRDAGHAIIFITHKLGEALELADRITVLRQGRVVSSVAAAETTQRSLAQSMVGREVKLERLQRQGSPGVPVLTVHHLWAQNDRGQPALRHVSFTLHQGEILGVVGVAGNGQHELVEVLTGLRKPTAGQVLLLGREMTGSSARSWFDMGVAHIPAERHHMGVVPTLSVADNLVLRHYRAATFGPGLLLNQRAVAQFATQAIAASHIATPHLSTPVRFLSGGTVQRLILARELSGQPRVIVAAHPTYGLDIGATEHTHNMLLQQRERGAAIVLVSEDLDEVLHLADRIIVLCAGEVMGMVPGATADRERLGLLMAGIRSRLSEA